MSYPTVLFVPNTTAPECAMILFDVKESKYTVFSVENNCCYLFIVTYLFVYCYLFCLLFIVTSYLFVYFLAGDVGLDDKVAHSAIPFSCLRKGYRSIPLYDKHDTRSGPFGFALLFVEISY